MMGGLKDFITESSRLIVTEKFLGKLVTIRELFFCKTCNEIHFYIKEDSTFTIFSINWIKPSDQLEFNFNETII